MKEENKLVQNKPAPTDLKGILGLEATREQIAAALPTHLSPERQIRSALTALNRTPALLKCTQMSFFKCLLDCSSMGLEPDGRRAHLIPYGKECTLIIDYKGLVELVRRNGDVAKIHADVICQNDVFNHSMGEVTEHSYSLVDERGDVIGAYAQVWFKSTDGASGEVKAEVMSKKEIDKIRAASKAGRSGPWVSHYNEMCKKTAFRRLTKWVTLSPEIRSHIDNADDHEFRNVTPERQQELRVKSNPFRLEEKTEEEQPTIEINE